MKISEHQPLRPSDRPRSVRPSDREWRTFCLKVFLPSGFAWEGLPEWNCCLETQRRKWSRTIPWCPSTRLRFPAWSRFHLQEDSRRAWSFRSYPVCIWNERTKLKDVIKNTVMIADKVMNDKCHYVNDGMSKSFDTSLFQLVTYKY
jgi:hypothetical protein